MRLEAIRLTAQGSRRWACLAPEATAEIPGPNLLTAVGCQLPAVLAFCILQCAFVAACAGGPPQPATLDPGNDTCARCRMAVSDRRFAAQIVAPGEEPIFFDDLGCLREHLAGTPALPAGAVVYVADHRTTEWVNGVSAVFTHRAGLASPMASGLMAHRDPSSRDQDRAARGGSPVAGRDVLGALAGGGEK